MRQKDLVSLLHNLEGAADYNLHREAIERQLNQLFVEKNRTVLSKLILKS